MKDYKPFAINLAYKAGEIMRKNFTLGMEKSWKDNNTPVTVSDMTINRMVVESVQKYFPTHDVLGEEESDLKESEYVWVCDPLDGTIPFAHGIPTSTFSLALTHEGRPIFAVVYDPYMDRLFTAEKGKGAFLNDQKITVSKQSSLRNTAMTIEGANKFEPFLNIRQELSLNGTKVFSLMAFIYSGMLVAAGELMAAIFVHRNAWDVAAVKLLVEEAGGKCTDLYGNDQRYDRDTNGFVASNGLVHDQLIELLKKYHAVSHK